MVTDHIPQFKQPAAFLYRGPAEKNMGLDPGILDKFCADDLIDIHTQQLVFLVLHPKAEGPDIPICATD